MPYTGKGLCYSNLACYGSAIALTPTGKKFPIYKIISHAKQFELTLTSKSGSKKVKLSEANDESSDDRILFISSTGSTTVFHQYFSLIYDNTVLNIKKYSLEC